MLITFYVCWLSFRGLKTSYLQPLATQVQRRSGTSYSSLSSSLASTPSWVLLLTPPSLLVLGRSTNCSESSVSVKINVDTPGSGRPCVAKPPSTPRRTCPPPSGCQGWRRMPRPRTTQPPQKSQEGGPFLQDSSEVNQSLSK